MNDDWQMDFALRLKEERLRLGLTESDMATRAVLRSGNVQFKYETAQTLPKPIYFVYLARLDFDIAYLFTGERTKEALSIDEQALVAAFNELDIDAQFAVLKLFGLNTPLDSSDKARSWKKLKKPLLEELDERAGRKKTIQKSIPISREKLFENLDEKYLQELADAGLDVQAMLASAAPENEELTPEELALLDNYRNADEDGKKAACKILDALSQQKTVGKRLLKKFG